MKKRAISGIEFLVVVIILFVIFMILVDLTLYFRQTYLVQAINDEAHAKIETLTLCNNSVSVTNALRPLSENYFNINDNYSVRAIGNGATVYSSGRYSATVKCNGSNRIEGISSRFLYDGIFMFRNRNIYSNYSSSVSYY